MCIVNILSSRGITYTISVTCTNCPSAVMLTLVLIKLSKFTSLSPVATTVTCAVGVLLADRVEFAVALSSTTLLSSISLLRVATIIDVNAFVCQLRSHLL